MDTNSWVLWIAIVAIGLHVMEEYAEGWLAWANQQVGPRFGVTFTQADFFFTAFLLIFYALAAAAIGWWAPAVSLAIPALFIVNTVFLHMLPSLRGDRLTPGTLSAVFIYLPVAAWIFWAAAEDGVLNLGTVVLAFILGTALMYYPLAVAILAKRIGWQEQPAEAPAPPADDGSTEPPGHAEPPKPPGTADAGGPATEVEADGVDADGADAEEATADGADAEEATADGADAETTVLESTDDRRP
jgi:hypothetical protein